MVNPFRPITRAGCSSLLCGLADESKVALLCDGCDGAFHLKCLKRKTVPKGDWFCDGCKQARKEAAAAEKKPAASSKKENVAKEANKVQGGASLTLAPRTLECVHCFQLEPDV